MNNYINYKITECVRIGLVCLTPFSTIFRWHHSDPVKFIDIPLLQNIVQSTARHGKAAISQHCVLIAQAGANYYMFRPTTDLVHIIHVFVFSVNGLHSLLCVSSIMKYQYLQLFVYVSSVKKAKGAINPANRNRTNITMTKREQDEQVNIDQQYITKKNKD